MRSRAAPDDSVADVTRRRLDALIAELAAARGELPPEPRTPDAPPAANGNPAPADRSVGGRHAQRSLGRGARLVGWVQDRLPAAVLGQAHLGAAQFGLVALVVAGGLVIGAWALVRAGGDPGDVVPPRTVVPSTSATPSSSGMHASGPERDPATVPGAEGQIVVDVVGRVRDPGIAVLPLGSRVVDAVRAAGGMRPGVDPAAVNLARLLSDGEQVVIGVAAPALPAASLVPGTVPSLGAPGAGTVLVDLNTADQATLETLPGVGPVTAAAIIAWRTEHGGFTAVEELLEISGIGDATLAEIAPHVTV